MSQTVTDPRRRRRVRLLILGGFLLLASLAGEITARILVEPRTPIRFQNARDAAARMQRRVYGDTPGDDMRTYAFTDVFREDPELFWAYRPNVTLPPTDRPIFGVISNGQGLREDHEIAIPKPEHEVRILFLGDSCTFGYRLPHEQTVCELVEAKLEQRFPQLAIECINAGVLGYTLFQGWRFLETRAMRYEPDLVVLNFGWNALGSWDGRGDLEHFEALRAQQPPSWLGWSHLARFLFRIAKEEPQPVRRKRYRLEPHEFREVLDRIATWALEHHRPVLLLVGGNDANIDPRRPAQDRSPLQGEMYAFGAQHPFGPNGEPGYVDGVPIMQNLARFHAPEELLFDDIHPTLLVNQQLAAAVFLRVSAWLEAR